MPLIGQNKVSISCLFGHEKSQSLVLLLCVFTTFFGYLASTIESCSICTNFPRLEAGKFWKQKLIQNLEQMLEIQDHDFVHRHSCTSVYLFALIHQTVRQWATLIRCVFFSASQQDKYYHNMSQRITRWPENILSSPEK